jgi:hypothetical protein
MRKLPVSCDSPEASLTKGCGTGEHQVQKRLTVATAFKKILWAFC